MLRVMLVTLGVFVVLGSVSAFQFRERMSSARLGTDVVYALDSRGNAAVEMTNKSYFVDADTEKNFDAQVARLGQPDSAPFQKGVEDSLKNVSAGREMSVTDFEASFERTEEYGAQVFRFRWNGFAQPEDGAWVVDFKAAKPMKFTKDSSLVVVLPDGTSLVKADPAPTSLEGGRLVWVGTGEMPWPHLEFKQRKVG